MSKVTIYSPSATAQIKHCAVDFDLRREPVPIHLVQYDKTLPILEVALYKGSVPYRLPEDAEANVRMGKRNNLIVYNPVLGCGENRDRVYIAITPQMTTQEGIFDPIVEVLVDGGLAGTSPMRLVVHRNPAQEDAIEDTSEVKTLVDLVKQASESAEQARQSASIADQSAAEAVKSAAEAKESAVEASKAAENAANSVAGIEEKVRQATASAQSAADSANTAAADAVRAEEAAERAEQIADFDPSQFATAAQGKLADSSVQSVNGIKPLDGNVQLELGSGSVQSVNAKGPDEEGNVQLTVQDLGAATAEQGGKADTAVQPADLEPYAKTAELPKKLPNPQSFGIRVGVSGDLVEYDGSAAKEISITPEAIGVQSPEKYYTKEQVNSLVPWQYTALYLLDAWVDADEDAKSKGYAYQQTVALTPDDPDAPTVTSDSKFRPEIGSPKTGVAETDDVLKEALNIIADGVSTTGAGTVTTLVQEKPTTDIPVVWTLRTEV